MLPCEIPGGEASNTTRGERLGCGRVSGRHSTKINISAPHRYPLAQGRKLGGQEAFRLHPGISLKLYGELHYSGTEQCPAVNRRQSLHREHYFIVIHFSYYLFYRGSSDRLRLNCQRVNCHAPSMWRQALSCSLAISHFFFLQEKFGCQLKLPTLDRHAMWLERFDFRTKPHLL